MARRARRKGMQRLQEEAENDDEDEEKEEGVLLPTPRDRSRDSAPQGVDTRLDESKEDEEEQLAGVHTLFGVLCSAAVLSLC